MSALALQSALAASGIVAGVEARDRLAVIVPDGDEHARAVAARRAWVISTASAHGFTHVAVEVATGRREPLPPRGDATVSGD